MALALAFTRDGLGVVIGSGLAPPEIVQVLAPVDERER
jgi:hypothetical protein